ncbi:MAG TPA: hypothetical protein VGB70_05735 [Allosphingosinicella sp.]|jgi:hypothetical protein
MSRKLCALMILATASAPAWAQTQGERVSTGSPFYSGHLLPSEIRIDSEPRPCLVRIKTGRTECRTKDEWRRLAEKIGRNQQREQEQQTGR